MAGPWEKYGGGLGGGDPVIAPPDPYKQAAEARAAEDQARENARFQFDQQKFAYEQQQDAEKREREQQEAADKATRAANAQTSAIESLVRVIDKLDQVYADSRDNGGLMETGTSGSLARKFGPEGWAGADLAKDINTIDANSAFAKLQEMRDNSPTGGALGQVTEKELDLLKSSITNIDPNLSQNTFIRNVGEAKGAYIQMLRRLDPAKAEEIEKRGEPVMDANGNITYDDRQREALGGSPGGAPPGGTPTPDQEAYLRNTPEGQSYLSQIGSLLGAGVGDIVEGAGDLAGIVVNPVHATINAVTGSDLTTDFGGYLRNDLLGAPAGNPTIGAINQGATAALAGGGIARGAASLANPGVAQNVFRTIGATPIRDAAAGGGAGFGSQVTQDYGPVAQTAGAVAGGMLGYAGANSMLRGMTPTTPTPLAQAATRQGVDMLPADAGGTIARGVTTGAKASPLSSGPIVQRAQAIEGQMSSAADRVARGQGAKIDTQQAGENVRAAGERFTKQTSERANRLYEKAYEQSKGIKIKPLRTIAALDDEIARLQQNPDPGAASSLKELTALRDNIAGGVSVQGLRDARTSLSQGVYDGKLRSGADRARYKAILNNVADDIRDGLKDAGRDQAADMFNNADEFWKARVEHIDEVLQPILGKNLSGEQIVKSVESMARGASGGNARLSRLLANMTDEEAGQVRATIVDRLGKAKKGQQTADGEAFSASTFLTNWNDMTPQAKASLFSDKGLRSDLNDIALLAENQKAAQSMANHTNTALANYSNVGLGIGVGMASPLAAVTGAGAQFLTGKLMASPGFARILARTSKMPPEAGNRKFIEQLGVLAGREPLIAADARALQQHLQQSLGQSPVRAAANEEEQN